MSENEKLLLEKELKLLNECAITFKHSFDICKEIGIKETYSIEELDSLEALTARFSRTSDIIIQKIFRLIDIIELESNGSIIDRINRAEKREIIESSEVFKDIRRIRNEIAHEYIPAAIEDIFKKVLALSSHLLKAIEGINHYCKVVLFVNEIS